MLLTDRRLLRSNRCSIAAVIATEPDSIIERIKPETIEAPAANQIAQQVASVFGQPEQRAVQQTRKVFPVDYIVVANVVVILGAKPPIQGGPFNHHGMIYNAIEDDTDPAVRSEEHTSELQ